MNNLDCDGWKILPHRVDEGSELTFASIDINHEEYDASLDSYIHYRYWYLCEKCYEDFLAEQISSKNLTN